MSLPLKDQENNVEHATIDNIKDEVYKLLEYDTVTLGKEAVPERYSTYHTLTIKAHDISLKSGLIA